MLYWFPKTKNLSIPQPSTVIVEIPNDVLNSVLYASNGAEKIMILTPYISKINEAINQLGYPVFMRSDQGSGKHEWSRTCFIKEGDNLYDHVSNLLEWHHMVSMVGEITNYRALVFRQFIEMDTKFTAFYHDMPVNPERRYFIKDGKLLCHHPYWIEDSIRDPSIPNWKETSKEMNYETHSEQITLRGYTFKIAKVLEGSWSIDFCRGKDGKWWFIDAALASQSWHPDTCPQKKEFGEFRI